MSSQELCKSNNNSNVSNSNGDVNNNKENKNAQVIKKRSPHDFEFYETIGEGSYSTVTHAREINTNKEFAIKILNKKHIIKEKKVKYVNVEKAVLNKLHNHPLIIRLFYTFQDSYSLYFVLDLAKKGDLLGYIRKLGSFNMECTQFYTAEIITALEYLHKKNIIHRDLKPENILITESMHIKLTDFGTAKILGNENESNRANSFVGTAEYVSPELLNDKSTCKSSDFWALGCIIYQLLAGRPPFKGSNEYQTFQKIIKMEYSFPPEIPEIAKDLIQKLLIEDPNKRIGADTPEGGGYTALKSHPFFNGIVWEDIHLQTPPELKPNPLAPISKSNQNLSHGSSSDGNNDEEENIIYGNSLQQQQQQQYPYSNSDFFNDTNGVVMSSSNRHLDGNEMDVSQQNINNSSSSSSVSQQQQYQQQSINTNINQYQRSIQQQQQINNNESRLQNQNHQQYQQQQQLQIYQNQNQEQEREKRRQLIDEQRKNLAFSELLSPNDYVIRWDTVNINQGGGFFSTKRRIMVLTDQPCLYLFHESKPIMKGQVGMTSESTLKINSKNPRQITVHTQGKKTKIVFNDDSSAESWIKDLTKYFIE